MGKKEDPISGPATSNQKVQIPGEQARKIVDSKIRSWLKDSNRDFHSGYLLLVYISTNNHLLKEVREAEEDPESFNYKKLYSRMFFLFKKYLYPETFLMREKREVRGNLVHHMRISPGTGSSPGDVLIKKIQEWFKTSRNYEVGIRLLGQGCRNIKLLTRLTAKRSARNEAKLLAELGKIIRESNFPGICKPAGS